MSTSDGAQVTPVQQLLASCSGAVLTSLFATPLDVVKVRLQQQLKGKNYVTPLDVVKIRLQAQHQPSMYSRCFVVRSGLMDHLCTFCGPLDFQVNASLRFKGTLDAIVKISRHEGIGSLWSGLSPALMMAVPATMCYFTLYDNLVEQLRQWYGSTFWVPMVAGSSARVVSATLISPLEMVRTKLQSKKMKLMDVLQALCLMMRQRGFGSLYLGLVPTLLRDVPFSAIYWTCFEHLKFASLRHLQRTDTTFSLSLTLGAISGTIAAVLTLPFDVLKTHRQIMLGEMTTVYDVRSKAGTWTSIDRLIRERGVRSLFSGLVPRLVKVAPACAIMIATYDYGKLWFQTRNKTGSALCGIL